MSSYSAVVVATVAGAVLAACASGPPPATDAIERAQVALERAERVGASQSAAEDLNQARTKLQQARDADRDRRKQPPTALQLAQQAELDAEVAEARTRAAQAETAANELRRSLDALRQETQQNQQSQQEQGQQEQGQQEQGQQEQGQEGQGQQEPPPAAGPQSAAPPLPQPAPEPAAPSPAQPPQ